MMIESGPSVRYASASQHPFGGRDRIGLARIDLDRDAQGPRQPLERRFGDVVVILAVERLDVARQPRGLRQAVEEMLEHLDRKSVLYGKRVSVRVDISGRRIMKKIPLNRAPI